MERVPKIGDGDASERKATARLGGQARARNLPGIERSRAAQLAALARWDPHRSTSTRFDQEAQAIAEAAETPSPAVDFLTAFNQRDSRTR
jgi:hypothetical protein